MGVVWELLAKSSVLASVGFRECKMLEIESSIWCAYAFFWREWSIAYYIRFSRASAHKEIKKPDYLGSL